MDHTSLPPTLVKAYTATNYRIQDGAVAFDLRVGRYSAPLAELLANHASAGATFITADNPFSRPTSAVENRTRSAALLRALQSISSTVFRGQGVGDDESWPPEQSFLALGLDQAAACRLGREFEQNAIVWAGLSYTPELVLLR
jgi:hypothetical protein